MNATAHPAPSKTVENLKAVARLLNRKDLLSGTEAEARVFNAAEQAVRDGIALIEEPGRLFQTMPLVWGQELLCGVELSVGRGLGLKYYVSKNSDASGWSWTIGDGAGPVEPTEEAARAGCQADFDEKVRASIRPLATAS